MGERRCARGWGLPLLFADASGELHCLRMAEVGFGMRHGRVMGGMKNTALGQSPSPAAAVFGGGKSKIKQAPGIVWIGKKRKKD